MPSSTLSAARIVQAGLAAIALVALLIIFAPQSGRAQDTKRPAAPAAGDQIARGKYLVEDVAMCQTCHTPRNADGRYNRSLWLQGGPVPYFPAEPNPNWPQVVPRIGGRLPATPEQMVTLLTTGIWITGVELRDPMPKFHMNRADAEAVVAYLRSVTSGR